MIILYLYILLDCQSKLYDRSYILLKSNFHLVPTGRKKIKLTKKQFIAFL